jgi:LacI family transcriptional regulator
MHKTDKITIKDIAKSLNLSVSTVSRALQDSYQISNKTRDTVKKFAKENHYTPNLMAQGLRNNKTRSIGLMLCSIPNNFYAEVINGIESATQKNDYHLIITQSQESFKKEKQNLDFLYSRGVDGILISISTETQDYEHFNSIIKKNLPIVFFDRIAEIDATHKVVAENSEGAYKATAHLLSNGYKNIGHITSSKELSITKERLIGFHKALEQFDILQNESNVKYCDHGGLIDTEIENALDELLYSPNRVDAIFTASDRITIKTLSSLQKRGLIIPNDIAIVGFTDFSAPELFSPGLTTIKQPAFDMGKIAAELLIKQIERKSPIKDFERIVLPTTLTIRRSSLKKI